MNKLTKKSAEIIAKLSLKAASFNVNSVCMYIMYQPKVPEAAKKLRKF